jgi:hypothetical protein
MFRYVEIYFIYYPIEYLFFDLFFIQNNFKNIFSQDLIGWSKELTASEKFFFDFRSLVVYLYVCSYICLALIKGNN